MTYLRLMIEDGSLSFPPRDAAYWQAKASSGSKHAMRAARVTVEGGLALLGATAQLRKFGYHAGLLGQVRQDGALKKLAQIKSLSSMPYSP